ncbi:hypothetical protein [Paenirhodobacter hankyongi]|uniref:hypothetical protein n=1 Tax=Paenirhodobacter hankyongi TaxID=2294033 RepID=UPI001603EF6C|nr:hypothetical protein [Sinirhodobacter hankyongi]
MKNIYLSDEVWHRLAADLVEAAQHPADPESAVKIVLANAGVMPEGCRDDCEGVAQIAA